MKIKVTPGQWAEIQRLLRAHLIELEMTQQVIREVLAEKSQAAESEQPAEEQ